MPDPACPPVPNPTSADRVGSVTFEYDRTTERLAPYRLRNIHPSLVTALRGFTRSMADHGMRLTAIVTGGAYNCRYSRGTTRMSPHGTGKAIDVDGVRFKDGKEISVRQYREETEVLDRVQACLRMHFGVVLDWRYNDLHRDHFHCDLTKKVGVAGKSLILYVQAALNRLMDAGLQVDGDLGTNTRAALRKFERQNSLTPTGAPKGKTLRSLLTAAAGGRDMAEEMPGAEWSLSVDGATIRGIIMVDGKTYMPVRSGFEAIGYDITVDGRNITATKPT
ncbi:MAG: extensin family protein [Armatimonadota bacterium]|nr:MAG: extensin family protein [Armatimonadota bacterium]